MAPGDVERVLDAARAVALPLDRDVLHVLPQEFVVDDQDGIKEPVGMCGVRLEARVHIVTARSPPRRTSSSAATAPGCTSPTCSAPLAAAEAVLTPEEKELGVALIEIGAGTTRPSSSHGGAIQHTAVLPVGGNHVSNDIAAGLRTPFRDAELLKRRFGVGAGRRRCRPTTVIEVPGIGGRAPHKLSQRVLAEIIEPRCEEIFALVAAPARSARARRRARLGRRAHRRRRR